MPRDLPVGNGSMLVAFDDLYRVRDLYWPHVGVPNHTGGHPQRFGVWCDGDFAWIEDDGWRRDLRYKPETLATEVRLVHDRLGLELVCRDIVDHARPVFFRTVEVHDLRDRPRDVRVFFHHDISVNESAIGDTVNYDPRTGGLVHYKGDTYFLINGRDGDGWGIDQWATGQKRIGSAEGTWRDAEDGLLERNPIAQGSVDSTVGFNLAIPARGRNSLTYWLAAGSSYAEVVELDTRIREVGPKRLLERTEAYWRLFGDARADALDGLDEDLRDLFVRSLLVVRTQIDDGGGIIAANDYDITHMSGDTYSYVWPRDGALVAEALDRAGRHAVSHEFFRFAARVVEPDGYFLHKYSPTGTLASSWHPWMIDGEPSLPIQQDETALVVWALRRHIERTGDIEFLREVYEPLVERPARWMLSYRDHHGLPKASWDLWEERHGIHLFTVAATIGALDAAGAFARELGELDRAAEFCEGADRMRGSLLRRLWSEDHGRFARMAVLDDDGTYRLDMTPDASGYALFAFDALPADDPRVESHMQTIRERLWVQTPIGGIARYTDDPYHRVVYDRPQEVPGNPWAICTLWYASWLIARATSLEELEQALPYLRWCRERALPSGVLAEQFDPLTGDPMSVSPLTWSHAVVLSTWIEYAERHRALTRARRAEQARTSEDRDRVE
jgi:glucoamylase